MVRGAVPGKGSRLQQHVCCEGSEYVVGDRKVCTVQFILSVLHVNYNLVDAWVAVLHVLKAEDEFYAGGEVKASTKFGKMIKKSWCRYSGKEGTRLTQLLNSRCFDVSGDEVE